MKFTEVKVQLLAHTSDRLRAFASFTIDDCLLVRDIKVLEGPDGLFVAMPSRRVTDRCRGCGGTNPINARFCGGCGRKLADHREKTDVRGKPLLYADVAHPLNKVSRDLIVSTILAAYQLEVERSKKQGYVRQTFDGLDYGEYEQGNPRNTVRRVPPLPK